MVTIERGRLNFVMGNTTEANKNLEDAIASLRKQDEPVRLAEALCNLAELRADAGDMAGARTLLDEAEALRRKVMPAAHPALAAVQRQLSALKLSGR
jgi:ATP/maltotriose-dependent transcriptional regulator MalT